MIIVGKTYPSGEPFFVEDRVEAGRRDEERARNAERFGIWSTRYWHRQATIELEAALSDEKAKLSGRLAAAFDEFEGTAFRVGLLAVAAFILKMEKPYER